MFKLTIKYLEIGSCKSLRQLKPFAFFVSFRTYEIHEIWNWPILGWLRNPIPETRYREFWDLPWVFWPQNWVSDWVLEPSRNQPVSYRSGNSKKSRFAGPYFKMLLITKTEVICQQKTSNNWILRSDSCFAFFAETSDFQPGIYPTKLCLY